MDQTNSAAETVATNQKDSYLYSGRPRVQVDAGLVQELASQFCTNKEICAKLGMSLNALMRNYGAELVQGRGNAHTSLRAAQYRVAIVNGNAQMLIFLGKQYLGQSDKIDNTVHESRTVNITPDAIANKIDSLLAKALGRTETEVNTNSNVIEGVVSNIEDDHDHQDFLKAYPLPIEQPRQEDVTDFIDPDSSGIHDGPERAESFLEDENGYYTPDSFTNSLGSAEGANKTHSNSDELTLFSGEVLSGEELARISSARFSSFSEG